MQPLRTPGQVECRVRLRLCAVGRDGAPLFTGCASTYGVQYTVAAWSFLVLHDTVSVAFTASHTSREFTIYRIFGACIGENARLSTADWATARPVRRGPTVPRPTARTAKSVLQRLNASVARGGGLARLGERGLGPKTPSPCAGSCAVVIDRVSSLIRVHTTIHSSLGLAKVTVLVLPLALPAQPF